jgi:hypothetical protein
VKLYGAFMHLGKLLEEARYDDLLASADASIKKFSIKPKQTSLDEIEQRTYFTKESLANFIVLYKYKAKVPKPAETFYRD